MSKTLDKASAVSRFRAPYRAPTLSLVLHHSETHNKGGVGFDGDPKVNNNRS